MRKGPELAFGAIESYGSLRRDTSRFHSYESPAVHGYIMALLYQPTEIYSANCFKAAVIVGYSLLFLRSQFSRRCIYQVIFLPCHSRSCHACFLSCRRRASLLSRLSLSCLSLSNLLLVMPTQGIFSFTPSPYHACLVMPTSCHADVGASFCPSLSLSCLFLVSRRREASLFCMPGNEASSCPACLCHACFLSCRRRGISSCPVCLCHPVSCHADRRSILLSRPLPCPRLSLSCLFLVIYLSLSCRRRGISPTRPFLSRLSLSCLFLVMPTWGIFSFSRPLPCHACLCHACFLSCRRRRHPLCHAGERGISSCPACLCHACFLSCRRRRHLTASKAGSHYTIS